MPTQTWTLVDRDREIFLDHFALGPDRLGGAAGDCRIVKRTLQGGLSQGVDVIEIIRGDFSFVVLPTRGMGIWRARLGDLSLGWKSPVRGPVHPAYVRTEHPDGLGWLDGFDELLVRCGLESNGAPEFHPDGRLRYGLHGKIANLPAHKVTVTVDDESGRVAICGTVDEARLFGSKFRLETSIETHPRRPGIVLCDTVTNLSAAPRDFELLYHVNFGQPLVQCGSKAAVPVKRLSPRDAVAAAEVPQWNCYGPETPGSAEACFFIEPASDAEGKTEVLLHDAEAAQGISLRFNTRQLPCFTIWKNREAACDGYVTGLEPATNFPNVKSFEQRMGRVVELEPGQSRSFDLELEPLTDAGSVKAAAAAVARLQQTVPADILVQPDPRWSAA